MSSISEISLITRAKVFHDQKAFGQLVMKYQLAIRRFFLAQTLGDGSLSDDLAQDTFVKAYTALAQYRGQARFSTWLYRIAYNVHCDYVRRYRATADLDASPQVSAQATCSTNETLHIDLYDALARLGDAERTCITLQLIDGYSIDKISNIMGLAEGTVKSHLSRGKSKLAIFLKKNGYDR